MRYTIETIPGEDIVYRALHKQFFRDGRLVSGKAFKFNEDGCSVEWAKYDSRSHARNFNKNKSEMDYGVGDMIVDDIRDTGLGLVHDPLPSERYPSIDNQSHSVITMRSVNREDINEYQLTLLERCKVTMLPGC